VKEERRDTWHGVLGMILILAVHGQGERRVCSGRTPGCPGLPVFTLYFRSFRSLMPAKKGYPGDAMRKEYLVLGME